MKYKINIHSHTIFSDGFNSPYVMALKAKELGFTALVITDHFYGRDLPDFMTLEKLKLLKKACNEVKKIIPVILGLEVPFMGQEVLVFGGSAVQNILEHGKPNMEQMLNIKKETGCAVILCHPGHDFHFAIPAIDGYERINGGSDLFICGDKKRSLEGLVEKPAWCNSDAHTSEKLELSYNIVDSKIETEHDLIKYIKKQKQPEFYVKN